MSANASWGTAPTVSKNASWGLSKGGGTGGSGSRSKLGMASLLGKNGLGGLSLGGKRKENRLSAAVSTSALANLATAQSFHRPGMAMEILPQHTESEYEGSQYFENSQVFNLDDENQEPTIVRPKVQLRRETLRSLGISVKSKIGDSPRSVLKKTGEPSLARSNTLSNMKRVPTEVELSNGRVLRRNTSITFNEKVRCRKIPSAASLADDPTGLWFQDNEMRTIRKNAKMTVTQAMAEKKDAPESEDFCLRGLEGHFPDAKKESRVRKYEVWDTVLDQQEFHLQSRGEYADSSELSTLVRNVSSQSLKIARQRAEIDASAMAHG